MARPWLVVPVVAFALAGCASLIGASFEDAHPVADAGVDGQQLPPVDAASDGGVVDPAAIPGLFAWFSADFGVTVEDGGSNLQRWQSHVPAQYAEPIDAVTSPTFVSVAQRDQPAVRFDASRTQLLKVNGKGLGGKEATIFVAGKGSMHGALAFRVDASSSPFIAFPYDVHVGEGGGGITAGLFISGEPLAQLPIRPNAWGLWEARYAAGVLSGIETFLNGVPTDRVTPVLPALPDDLDLYLGGVPPPTSGSLGFYDGDLGEVLVYRAALDDSARRGVEAYLSKRWDVPLGK